MASLCETATVVVRPNVRSLPRTLWPSTRKVKHHAAFFNSREIFIGLFGRQHDGEGANAA